ncbi:cache domain-containing protein [Thiotrichales bacterium HSG1]|nr:cache domain-containing protein [Thiotrichales bacterium HSG1]
MNNLVISIAVLILSIYAIAYFTIQSVEIRVKQLIIEKNQNQLITIRDSKKQQVISYLTELHKQIKLYSNDKNVIATIYNLNNISKNSKNLMDKYYSHINQYHGDIEDILLVNIETDTIVYSVNKNVKFTTLPSSPLNLLFQQVNSSNQTKIIDFTPYFQFHNTYAAFLGTPVFSNGKKIGILVLQINSEYINTIMTYSKNWQSEKSGNTGESYIVAIDGTMRNDSRKLVEYKEDYLLAIEQAGLSNDIVTKINLKNTSIGLQKVNTPGTEAVFIGITGQDLYIDYNDEFVFAVFTPLNIFGLQWAVFATIEENEVLELVAEFTDKITDTIIQIAVIILIIASLLLWLVIPTKPLIAPKGYTVKQIIEHINKLR